MVLKLNCLPQALIPSFFVTSSFFQHT